jgi:Tfp pilus assembly protein PilV
MKLVGSRKSGVGSRENRAAVLRGRFRAVRKGLSLIEVLLALAIFIMSLAAIGLLIGMGSDHATETRLNNTAARLAQAKLAEVEAGVIELTEPGGTFEGSDAAWQWTLTAEQQGATLYLVTVTVSRDVNGRKFELSMGQYIIDPAVKGSATELQRPSATTTEDVP